MKVTIEAHQYVTVDTFPVADGSKAEAKSLQPAGELDITEELRKIVNEKLSELKVKYPDAVFRLHICNNDSQKPCMIEEL